jgi:hypothetical protein
MKGQTGIWIDEHKAIIVHMSEQRHWIEDLEAQVDYRLRITGHSRSTERLGFCYQSYQEKESEKIRLGRQHFMETIIESLEPDFHIAIFGPRQEKYELRDVLHKNPLFSRKSICLLPAPASTSRQEFLEMVYAFYGKQMAEVLPH